MKGNLRIHVSVSEANRQQKPGYFSLMERIGNFHADENNLECNSNRSTSRLFFWNSVVKNAVNSINEDGYRQVPIILTTAQNSGILTNNIFSIIFCCFTSNMEIT